MAEIQKPFEQFNKTICLGRFEEEQTLRDKRKIIQDKLRANLPKVFEKYGEECPAFWFRDQGSYELGTGVVPLKGDYDLDQGLYFEVSTTDYPDPVVLKKRVHEALDGHTKAVRIRRPCVTVFYQLNDEPIYHVDIAVYSSCVSNSDQKDYLATGRENSTTEFRLWIVSNPKRLADLLIGKYKDAGERAQFYRIIRYLKRWKDVQFDSNGYGAPRGIALTIAAYSWFYPIYTDRFSQKFNDLAALKALVNNLLNNFSTISWFPEIRRIKLPLPVEPNNDLFEKMTDKQMEAFEQKLKDLRDFLEKAEKDADPVTACEVLRDKSFGSDFPVPAKAQTAQRTAAPGIIGTHESA
ncbi:nucleotidyltransferase [Spirosoma sp. BT702]|uniref:Cyclic GMP-AMP synthase n=1 Tax=Spirosoma profusum TaxID=2771354 RepID=A0A926Y014_9BACT|nr:nucleotidyltransferase [Spirosoma profusum]MBD2703411.1 nucleotidyltransferase [Spirosoma profusum]